jgi:ADP-heptose:LPS heptosyltransferase
VVRANALGDYLLTEPALSALRAAAPAARIVLIGSDWHVRCLRGRPGPVDEVVLAPRVRGVRNPPPGHPEDDAATGDFFRRMQDRRFDLAVQLHGGGRHSNPFTRSLGASWSVGLRARDAPDLDRTIRYEFWQHEVARHLEVVALVGATPVHLSPELAVTRTDRLAADQVLRAAGLDPYAPLAVVHPGASDPRRRWPAEGFGAVCTTLADEGAQVVLVGTGEERGVTSAVREWAPRAIDLAGALTFEALVGLLARAAVMVGNDSGPRHLAAAVGAPTVSVYWFGNVITAGPVERAGHRVHISWTVRCPVCGARCVGDPAPRGCAHQVSFVADVPAGGVCASAAEVYADVVGRGSGQLSGGGADGESGNGGGPAGPDSR